jgi:hypothetical protein
MNSKIMNDLVNNAKEFDLEGVEFTDEDVAYVERVVNEGLEYDVAIRLCLSNIYEVLNHW